jgi:hypothetical protein
LLSPLDFYENAKIKIISLLCVSLSLNIKPDNLKRRLKQCPAALVAADEQHIKLYAYQLRSAVAKARM